MTKKKDLFFDPELGFYKAEVPEELEAYPHLFNEACVLRLSVMQEEADDTFALGLEQLGGAVSPWFDELAQLEEYCLRPGSREEMRIKKAQIIS